MPKTLPDPTPSPDRVPGFDALRGAVTLLVVLHHTAITYGAMGGWYYRELTPDRSLSSTLLVFFCTLNQAWFMGLFFLLAGCFTPGAIESKGRLRFLRDRALRLGLPLLVYGFLIGPATIALARTARGDDFGSTLLQSLRRGHFENGPLWFAQALLLFSLAAALLWRGGTVRPIDGEITGRRPWPSFLSLLAGALVTGAAALALRTVWPVGVNVWGLQLGYFASYVVLFAFGCVAAGPQWLTHLPPATVATWRRVAWIALPLLPALYFLGLPVMVAYAFWEPLVAWGVIMVLLDRFQRRLSTPGPMWRALSRRAYAVYVIHPPVVVAVALAWRGVAAPPLLKFAVTGAVACALCLLIAGPLVRLPGLRRVL